MDFLGQCALNPKPNVSIFTDAEPPELMGLNGVMLGIFRDHGKVMETTVQGLGVSPCFLCAV